MLGAPHCQSPRRSGGGFFVLGLLDTVDVMDVGRRGRGLIAAIAPMMSLACGTSSYVPRAQAPTIDNDARCREAAQKETPLLTEWSAAEKANLQAALKEGALAVEYTGCEMRPIPACQLRGSYRWQQTTIASDTIDIQSEDELFAKLPIGAFALEAELRRAGHLQVQTTVSGQYVLHGLQAEEVPDYGDCAQATHLLRGLSIGAFKLRSGDQIEAASSVEIAERGASASTRSSESVLREAGDPESCKLNTEEAPDIGCSSPVQAFLQPLPRFSREKGNGTIQATFVSGDADVAWELRSDQKFVCRTPCSRWMTPDERYQLRLEGGGSSLPGFGGGNLRTLDVPDLRQHQGKPDLQVVAFDKKHGRFITGVTLTGVGGGLMFMGGFLALAGGLGEESRLTVAGAITAGVGLVQIGPGIYLMATSGAKAEVWSSEGQLASRSAGPEPTRQMGVKLDF